MKAVVLAAGEGLRLRPFTLNKPKGMLRVANMPILHYVLTALKEAGIRDIIMVVGYSKEKIMNYFGNGREFGISITYVDQKRQLGTAHALLQARSLLQEEFIVVPGDNIIDSTLVKDLVSNRGKISIALTISEEPSKYGVVSLEGAVITEIKEKPEKALSNVISTGLFVFPPQIFDLIESQMKLSRPDITSTLKNIIDEKLESVIGVMSQGLWSDVVFPWDLLRVNASATAMAPIQLQGTIEPGVMIKGPVSVGKGSILRAGTNIEGPVVIGSGCEIGPYAVIRPSSSIGDDTTIKPFSVVQNSVIYSGCTLGDHSVISNTIIGDGTAIGPDFMTQAAPAHIFHDNEFHRAPAIGAIIGEDCTIGFRVCVESGVVIGNNAVVLHSTSVTRNLESGSRIGC